MKMGYTIGKRMTAYQPRAFSEPGAGPLIGSPGSASAGAPITYSPFQLSRGNVLTVQTGQWRALGALNPRFLWFSGGASISPGGSAASFSLSVAGTYGVTCRVSCGNATWGTMFKDVVAPGPASVL